MKPMTWLVRLSKRGQRILQPLLCADIDLQRATISKLPAEPEQLPRWVQHSPLAMRYLHFLGPLAWDGVPSRECKHSPPIPPIPYAPFLAACRVKVDQQIGSMARLRKYLVEHPQKLGQRRVCLVCKS